MTFRPMLKHCHGYPLKCTRMIVLKGNSKYCFVCAENKRRVGARISDKKKNEKAKRPGRMAEVEAQTTGIKGATKVLAAMLRAEP